MEAIQSKEIMMEDEIDLKELFSTIIKYKKIIILFTGAITFLTLVYTLSIPNSYASSTTLLPQTQTKSNLGGLSALAGMAGVDLSANNDANPLSSLETLLNDFTFQKEMIEKYDLHHKLIPNKENLVYPLGLGHIYKFFSTNPKVDEKAELSEYVFEDYTSMKSIISVSSDKESGHIILNAETTDRFLSKYLVDIYLKELIFRIREIDMQNVDKQIEYYKNELNGTADLSIKDQLSTLISGLMQKKVLALSNEFYNLKQFIAPQVSDIKDKTKPKRGLMVIVAFITSFIIGVFGIFLLDFLKIESINQWLEKH